MADGQQSRQCRLFDPKGVGLTDRRRLGVVYVPPQQPIHIGCHRQPDICNSVTTQTGKNEVEAYKSSAVTMMTVMHN